MQKNGFENAIYKMLPYCHSLNVLTKLLEYCRDTQQFEMWIGSL